MRVLGIIPARGGSKGVPHKNIRELAGRPLLHYTVEAAVASRSLSRTIVSTDDENVAAVAATCGADVPFLRPPDLARDNSPTIDLVRHALEWFDARDTDFDAVCLLQPTCPFRTGGDIKGAVERFKSSCCDTLISVSPVPHKFHPDWVYTANGDGAMTLFSGAREPVTRRQDLTPAFYRNGAIYITRATTIRLHKSLYGDRIVGYETHRASVLNIDTEDDWLHAEAFLKARPMGSHGLK